MARPRQLWTKLAILRSQSNASDTPPTIVIAALQIAVRRHPRQHATVSRQSTAAINALTATTGSAVTTVLVGYSHQLLRKTQWGPVSIAPPGCQSR